MPSFLHLFSEGRAGRWSRSEEDGALFQASAPASAGVIAGAAQCLEPVQGGGAIFHAAARFAARAAPNWRCPASQEGSAVWRRPGACEDWKWPGSYSHLQHELYTDWCACLCGRVCVTTLCAYVPGGRRKQKMRITAVWGNSMRGWWVGCWYGSLGGCSSSWDKLLWTWPWGRPAPSCRSDY